MLGNLIGGFITIVIGVNLIEPIADGVAQNTNGGCLLVSGSGCANLTGATGTILGLVPLFFALGIMSAGVALAVGGLRNAGLV